MQDFMGRFFAGESTDIYNYLGAHHYNNGKIVFRVYAPSALEVSLISNINNWNGENHHFKRNEKGVWELFIDQSTEEIVYKYLIKGADHRFVTKTDPFGFYSEVRPNNASILYDINNFKWSDSNYLKKRKKNNDLGINIYEVYLGSWLRIDKEHYYNYREIAKPLIDYVISMGYTHIEIMPLTEHPFDGSWGYQCSGYFSPTSRYGSPNDLKYLINECHKANIGVIFDLVLVHFVKDEHGLINFDGTNLFEYPKYTDAHSEWGTLNFDLWKESVRSFLISAGNFWIDNFHFDGLRIDAVSNIIYWDGKENRGINQGAIDFIKRFNYTLKNLHPDILLIAEDSSSYPNITKPTYYGGLGFDYKWDLGWMNDTLRYYSIDPIYRKFHHNLINFSMAYFYNEKFILPLSHDEVVHGKKTIIDKMWGTYEQKFAQCRNLYTYMYTHPGKKLNFMGNEFGHFREFDEDKQLDYFLLKYPIHIGFKAYIEQLNKLYINHKSLFSKEYDYNSFKWIDADNSSSSVYTYIREADDECLIILLNMTPEKYSSFEIGVPYLGNYQELTNSDKLEYGGTNQININPLSSFEKQNNGFDYTLDVIVGPFAGIIFSYKK